MYTGPKQRRQTNPRYKANLFSTLTFGWTLETFKLGYTRDIKEADLYEPLPEHRSDVLGNAMQKSWEEEVIASKRSRFRRKPSLFIVLFNVFGFELIFYGLILAAMEFLIRLQQPLFLGLLLRYYNPVHGSNMTTTNSTYLGRLFTFYETDSDVSWGEAVFFAFGIIFCSSFNIMVQHPFMMGAMHIGMKMRVGVCSLIYRKALKVSVQAISESSAGLVVNLMANDVNRFDTGPLFLHYLWIGPLEATLMTLYLYRQMGISAVYGVLVVVAVVPFQIYLGSQMAHFRRETALKSDERVRLMKEIVMGIEVIKMYTWEQSFRMIIDTVRRQEIYCIKMTSLIRGIIMSFMMFISRFSIFITVFLYVTLETNISVENVFFLTCFYNILKQTMTLFFPQAVGQIAEMTVAIIRIRNYLLCEECQLPPRVKPDASYTEDTRPKKRVVVVDPRAETVKSTRHKMKASTSKPEAPVPPPSPPKPTDSNQRIAIDFKQASTFWIPSENKDDLVDITLQIHHGSLTTVIGSVGSGKSTLLHMILCELPCSSGGITIDGSVSYASQDPWLFVGSVRQNILFGQPFIKSRYMEVCKVCALERDISLFPHGDKTVVGERGVSLSGGQRARINLARAVYKIADIYLLDDPLSAVDTHVAKHIFEKCIRKYLAGKTVILVTHQLQFIKSVNQIIILDKGKLLANGSFDELNDESFEIIQLMKEKTREVREENNLGHLTSTSVMSVMSIHRNWAVWLEDSFADQRPEAEAQVLGRVGGSVYRDYFLAGAPCLIVIIVLFSFILAQICASACDYWITRWSKTEQQLTGDATIDKLIWADQGLQRKDFVIIFGMVTIATVAIALIRAFVFFTLCMRSSINLHDKMFECISHSPMSFFNSNPSGRILNRFSKDMGAVDELLPQAMIDCFQIILNLAGVVVVILMTDIALLIPIAAAVMIFYILRVIYIRTTGAVKRLEGITRSPVFSHLNATVLGLATIRSFGAESLLSEEFDRHQDLHSAAWYLFITCSRAFGYSLDVICLLFIICVTFSCLMKSDIDGSFVGLAITQSISLTGIFQWGMRQSAEMENQMTSVERIIEYTNLPREGDLRIEQSKPPNDWPKEGAIHFDNLCVRYSPLGNYVLNKLQFKIEPKEKIGIVGRTGAGKSSVIQSLFRLVYIDGAIYIDGIDTKTIGLHDLREKLSIIPQEPVLFSGTLRKNLDPFDEYSDEELVNALGAVELNEGHEGSELLKKEVLEGGSNFSVGERQLVCLARAIVRNNKVLMLDEATANVDARTDSLIQTAIRTHFQECTVLTIAHRLNTVIDSDKILVLDAGKLMEFDHPHILLRQNKGYFSKMVAETGPTMSKMLRDMAAESYQLKRGAS